MRRFVRCVGTPGLPGADAARPVQVYSNLSHASAGDDLPAGMLGAAVEEAPHGDSRGDPEAVVAARRAEIESEVAAAIFEIGLRQSSPKARLPARARVAAANAPRRLFYRC